MNKKRMEPDRKQYIKKYGHMFMPQKEAKARMKLTIDKCEGR
jgi:hypothetical protein